MIEVLYSKTNIFKFPKQVIVPIMFRICTGAFGMPCFFFALKYLPMSKGAIILGIAPLIVSVVAYFLLNEVLHPREIVCLIGAFIGMFIVNATKAENKHANTYDDMYTTGV